MGVPGRRDRGWDSERETEEVEVLRVGKGPRLLGFPSSLLGRMGR